MSATFITSDGKTIKRQQCQVFTRVMGYLRPVSHFNIGKKSEFYSRKYYDKKQSANAEFASRYFVGGCGCEG